MVNTQNQNATKLTQLLKGLHKTSCHKDNEKDRNEIESMKKKIPSRQYPAIAL